MPIYEFYCPDCNTIYSFLSKRVTTSERPSCPTCESGKKLEKQVSAFSSIGNVEEGDAGGDLPFDEQKMERALEQLAGEAESVSEDNPRQAAELLRKFSNMTGMELGDGMREALARLEEGEDPEAIEAEMGDALENEDPFNMSEGGAGGQRRRRPPPAKRDATLYEM